jgi:predicted DNA-binding protein YlxM (UPF0122 family)
VKCGRNDVKHLARGLCLYCYQHETEKKGRGKQRIAKGLASEKLNYKYLYEEYVNKERSLSDIAKDCRCARQYVYKKLRDFGIPLRTQKEARKLALDKKKIVFKTVDEEGNERLVIPGSIKINEDFFRHWSNEMAYVLGVIYTDGNINPGSKLDPFQKTTTRSPRLTITQKEPELLNKVSKLMNCDMKLRHRKRRGNAGALFVFDICSERIYDDLINLGLSPNKSKTIEFPNIPQNFVRHFIRGCWDGDGSVYISDGRPHAQYISGSLKFVESLVQQLHNTGIFNRTPPHRVRNGTRRVFLRDESEFLFNYPKGSFPLPIHKDKRANACYIKIHTTENLRKLFHYFYDGVDECMYLTRKYNIFVKGLNLGRKEETEQLTLDLES